ncbi:hypothetical protein ACIBO5_22025 [Nonomuraea angiospora]|uniref:hypothetical protein n=1 Tax=Nonomuraea angiospora TaxID=46172 RepID=UPI003794D023
MSEIVEVQPVSLVDEGGEVFGQGRDDGRRNADRAFAGPGDYGQSRSDSAVGAVLS